MKATYEDSSFYVLQSYYSKGETYAKVASQVTFTKQLTLAKFLKAWKEYDKSSDRCKLACSLYWVY